jgi:hypothetical protein
VLFHCAFNLHCACMQNRYSTLGTVCCPNRGSVSADLPRINIFTLRKNLLQVVAATGQVLLHRFYCKQSMIDFDVKVRCCAALFSVCS